MVISEVKGIWFLVAREQLEQQFGAAGFQDVLDAMPAEFQHALREPLASSWYAEEALQEALRAMRHTLVPDADDCRALLFSCTQRGVGRFFRDDAPFVAALRAAAGADDVEAHPPGPRAHRRQPGP